MVGENINVVARLSSNPEVGSLLEQMNASTSECCADHCSEPGTPTTSDHGLETAVFVSVTSNHMIDDPRLRDAVTLGAMLHDTGKGYIPGEIMSKPGVLDLRDKQRIYDHPKLGAYRVREAADRDLERSKPAFENWQWDIAVALAAMHHTFKAREPERYPDANTLLDMSSEGIFSTKAMRCIKVDGHGVHVAVCDAFSAIGGSRPYLRERLRSEHLPDPDLVLDPELRVGVIRSIVAGELGYTEHGDRVLHRLSTFVIKTQLDDGPAQRLLESRHHYHTPEC